MMIVTGYLFKKMPEKPFSIRAFEPVWGKKSTSLCIKSRYLL